MIAANGPYLPDEARKALALAFLLNMVWMNASEVFRYFAFVMPMMRRTMSVVPDVAPMSVPVFLIWGVWDTILIAVTTGFSWLMLERFGASAKAAVVAGSCVWAAVFVLFWVGLWNMNLATPAVVAVALPLAWIELVVAALIVRWAMVRRAASQP
jgi:hypothetical protein